MTIVRIVEFALAVAATALAADTPSHYSLKLTTLITPDMLPMGLLVKARVDGGPVLRMLLDSGAQHVMLDKRAAARSGRTAGSPFELVGVGTASKLCRRTAPGKVQIDDLVLDDCDILVVDRQILEGIDGIIPMSLFAAFLVRLDVPGKLLHLDAYPPDAGVPHSSDLPVRADNRLLFLRTVLNESQPGYVLLDTGATYSAVSSVAARASRNNWSPAHAISLSGAGGGIEGFPLSPGVRFRCGERVISADPAVVVDLSDFSRRHRFEVTGILGYPALRNAIVTMNYRDSLVRIEAK
ncbi:MAG: aspartyl protease family protein [Ignavibacteriota bacterium]